MQNAITTQFFKLGFVLLQNIQQAQMSMLGANFILCDESSSTHQSLDIVLGKRGIIVVESIKGYCDHNNAKDFQSRDSVPIYYQYVIERLMRRKSISLLIHIVPPRSKALELIQELLKHFPIRRVTALEDQELELLGKLNEWNATIFELEPGLYKDCHDFDMNKMHGRFEVLAHFLYEEGDTQDDLLLDHDDEEHTGSTQRCKGKEKVVVLYNS
ncbi:hypothetical protein JHK87_035122 [Glycine soja]|nr:hypothetical protein JHK87_035122 [Glycine soja]